MGPRTSAIVHNAAHNGRNIYVLLVLDVTDRINLQPWRACKFQGVSMLPDAESGVLTGVPTLEVSGT